MRDLIVGVLAIGGSALVLLAGVGVLRLPDVYARMHAATKAPTLGLVLIAIAAVVDLDAGRPKLGLAIAFVFITAPVASHLIGRAGYRAEHVEIRLEGPDELAAALDGDRLEPDESNERLDQR
jgi:multicomponent Na+:H+ antiporter subunit G